MKYLNHQPTQKERQLYDMLIQKRNDDESCCGILIFLATEEERQFMIDYINSHEDVSLDDLLMMAMDINHDRNDYTLEEFSQKPYILNQHKKKNTLVVLCGLPGSGKTYFAERVIINGQKPKIISTNEIRKKLYGDESNMGKYNDVFDEAKQEILKSLKNGLNVVFEATNLKRDQRTEIVNIAKKANAFTVRVFKKIEVETCIARNKKRGGNISEDVIRKMYEEMEKPSRGEGFDECYTLTNK